jgi:hypothetical protein
MTTPDRRDTAPGMGDPSRSDDIDSPGLRSDGAGSGAATDTGESRTAGPAPQAGDPSEVTPDPDPGRSGPQGGQLGSAGGGYGTGSAAGTGSLGSPDGEDVQVESGPGPQTEWLRTADGEGDQGPDR